MADEASKRAVAAPDGIIDGHVAEDRRLSAGEGGIVVPIEGKRARADLQLQIPGASRGVFRLGLLLDERHAGQAGQRGCGPECEKIRTPLCDARKKKLEYGACGMERLDRPWSGLTLSLYMTGTRCSDP